MNKKILKLLLLPWLILPNFSCKSNNELDVNANEVDIPSNRWTKDGYIYGFKSINYYVNDNNYTTIDNYEVNDKVIVKYIKSEHIGDAYGKDIIFDKTFIYDKKS